MTSAGYFNTLCPVFIRSFCAATGYCLPHSKSDAVAAKSRYEADVFKVCMFSNTKQAVVENQQFYKVGLTFAKAHKSTRTNVIIKPLFCHIYFPRTTVI